MFNRFDEKLFKTAEATCMAYCILIVYYRLNVLTGCIWLTIVWFNDESQQRLNKPRSAKTGLNTYVLSVVPH